MMTTIMIFISYTSNNIKRTNSNYGNENAQRRTDKMSNNEKINICAKNEKISPSYFFATNSHGSSRWLRKDDARFARYDDGY